MPSLTVCLFEDKVRSAPKTGPIHGVNPKAKVKPRIKFLKLLKLHNKNFKAFKVFKVFRV